MDSNGFRKGPGNFRASAVDHENVLSRLSRNLNPVGLQRLQHQPNESLYIHYTISQDYTGGQDAVTAARLTALVDRCRGRADPLAAGPVSGQSQAPIGTAAGSANSKTKRKYPRLIPEPDDHAPKKPPSAYVIFSNKIRKDVVEQNLSFTKIARLVGDRWQKLSQPEKERFEAQADAALERYHILLSSYRKTESYRNYARYLAEFKAGYGDRPEN